MAESPFAYDEDIPRPHAKDWSEHAALLSEVEAFLYYEADLLDQWQYEAWLDLLSEDALYWMPIRRNVRFEDWGRERTVQHRDLAWFDENKTTLAKRVAQLMTGVHWAEEPRSRISHLLSNVRLAKVDPSFVDATEVEVRDRFLVYRNHQEDHETVLIGKRCTELRRHEESWKITKRTVLLDQTVLLSQTLSFFI